MAFVGEILMGLREAGPDKPLQFIDPPTLGSLTQSQGVGSALTAQAYFFKASIQLPWGETSVTTESTITVTNPNNQVGMTVSGLPYCGGLIRVYVGTVTGQQTGFMTFSIVNPGGSQVIIFTGVGVNSGKVPLRSSAYNPDSDGAQINTERLYGWLNDGLELAGQLAGGIPDMTGFGSTTGQGLYVLTGGWKKFDTGWYDGYPVYFGRKNEVFRRNTTPGISALLLVDYYAESVRIEMWPQPSRTSGQTTTANAMGLTDSTVTLALSNFTLGFGLALIGNEIVSYASNAAGSMQGIIRGWGGTIPQIWPSGTAVTELNCQLSGMRMPFRYFPGNMMATINLPAAWADALQSYLLSRFRRAEREMTDSTKLLNEFTAKIQQLRTNKQYAGPVQIQAGGASRGAETYPGLGGPFGGVIVP